MKAVRGTRDLLPPETALWNRVEAVAREVFARYGFGEIRTPIFEATELFARGVGEETDIVSKEMYTWEDRARAQSEKAQSLTLRPENTAGVVRAYIEHKLGERGDSAEALLHWAAVPAGEGPQRRALPASSGRSAWRCWGRLRPDRNRRCAMPRCWRCWLRCSMSWACAGGSWQPNSVGSRERRTASAITLRREALEPVKARMCDDNQRRAETNPLRVLDSKEPADPGDHRRAAEDRGVSG